jgi:transcriptional regulator NrdR family protein
MNRRECPDCESYDTERVRTEWMTDMIEEIRICNDCYSQFTNAYSLFDKQLDDVP